MNALNKAKASVRALTDLLLRSANARTEFHRKHLPIPTRCRTKLYASGGMVKVLDANTNRVLGFRTTIREARWLQQALESGRGVTSA